MARVKCEEYHLQMNMYLDGELPVSQIAGLMAHVDSCAECKKQFEWLKVIAFETRVLVQDLPEELHDGVMLHIKDNTQKKKRQVRKGAWYTFAAAAAALIIIVTGASYLLNGTYLFGNPWGAEEANSNAGSGMHFDLFTSESSPTAAPGFAPAPVTDPAGDKDTRAVPEGTFELPGDIVVTGDYAFFIAAKGKIPPPLMRYSKVGYGEEKLTFVYVPAEEQEQIRKILLDEGLEIYDNTQGLPDALESAEEGLVIIVED